ncbi:hypothetical protein ACJIZ3_004013 [Penstemon smallii]|uniref:TmcA/NAT10 N-terminal domain-containing protein n=1 Tax=Penstemon smallii TaxID=265156 RepID=A0ABD3S0U6_9LAMI
MKKKVDERIRTLIKNGVNACHRSMFVIVGDKGLDRIVDLHHMLKNSLVKSRTKVLCNKKKLAMQVKKKRQRGLLDLEKVDAFSHFIETGGITYCKYEDSERILGNTSDMCILQDFEALTPNLLARTIETVAGGGLIILLLRSLFSLTSLKTMATDVHERFRTESYPQDSGRFNERFLLSLGSCKTCIVMDDELNILPISSHTKRIAPVSVLEKIQALVPITQHVAVFFFFFFCCLPSQLNLHSEVSLLLHWCNIFALTFLDLLRGTNFNNLGTLFSKVFPICIFLVLSSSWICPLKPVSHLGRNAVKSFLHMVVNFQIYYILINSLLLNFSLGPVLPRFVQFHLCEKSFHFKVGLCIF